MTSKTVTTKEELKRAKDEGIEEIIVKGKLAEDLHAARKVAKMAPAAIGALGALLAAAVASTTAAPLTGGTSMVVTGLTAVAATPIAVTSGLTVPAVILLSSLGVATVVALFKEYDVEFHATPPVLKLTKHR